MENIIWIKRDKKLIVSIILNIVEGILTGSVLGSIFLTINSLFENSFDLSKLISLCILVACIFIVRLTLILPGIIAGAIGLGAGALMVYGAMMLNAAVVGQDAYPMVELAGNIHPSMRYIYSVLLFFGLYSTAISCFYGTVTRLSYLPALKNMNNLVLMIIVSVVGVLLSQFGFSDLVGQVYPILGFGGLVVMAIMIWVAWLRIWGPNKDAQPLAA